MTGTVLEDGLRGAGGHLLNGDGERFMERFDPAAERATRDVVSRAIYAEMRAGRTTPMGGVYIEMGHLGPENVARRFPGMVKRCADCGFDLAGGRVEVVPTAHYMMGGVEFEAGLHHRAAAPVRGGRGLRRGARREPARRQRRGELHGVRRHRRRGDGAGGTIRMRSWADPDEAAIEAGVARAERPFSRPAGDLGDVRERLWRTMWDDVGVLRTRAGTRTGTGTHRVARRRAAGDWSRGRRPHVQPDVARLAEPREPHRSQPGDRARRARP